MKFTKKQIRILAVLNAVMLIMLVGVFLMPKTPPINTPVQGGELPPPPIVLDKYRKARTMNFNEKIVWETNFGGSNDENCENIYDIENNFFAVGSTFSTDHDFDGKDEEVKSSNDLKQISRNGGNTAVSRRTFITKLDANGKLEKYCLIDGELSISQLFSDGIFLVVNNAGTKNMYLISESLEILKSSELTLALSDKVIDAFYGRSLEEIHLVVALQDSVTMQKKLKILTVDSELKCPPNSSVIISHESLSIEYVNAFCIGSKYLIAANLLSEENGALFLYEWYGENSVITRKLDATITNRNYKALDFMPYANGYAAIILDSKKVLDIMTIDSAITKIAVNILNIPNIKDAHLFTNNENYFLFSVSENNFSSMRYYDNNLTMIKEYDKFKNFTDISSFKFTDSAVYFGGQNTLGAPIVCIISGGESFVTTLASANESVVQILPLSSALLMVCDSKGAGIEVGGNIGGSDAWIAKIKAI